MMHWIVYRVQWLHWLQRMFRQLLQLQRGPVVCFLLRVQWMRRLPRLWRLYRKLPKCLLGMHIL